MDGTIQDMRMYVHASDTCFRSTPSTRVSLRVSLHIRLSKQDTAAFGRNIEHISNSPAARPSRGKHNTSNPGRWTQVTNHAPSPDGSERRRPRASAHALEKGSRCRSVSYPPVSSFREHNERLCKKNATCQMTTILRTATSK